jgi:hypothetical protein
LMWQMVHSVCSVVICTNTNFRIIMHLWFVHHDVSDFLCNVCWPHKFINFGAECSVRSFAFGSYHTNLFLLLINNYFLHQNINEWSLLEQAAEECLEKGITVCRDGVNYKKIGKKISKLAYFYGYYVVDRFVGHGIGPIWHSEPLILHHGEYVDISLLLWPNLFFEQNFWVTV